MAENRERALVAGLEVVSFPPLAYGEVAGTSVPNAYLNLTCATEVRSSPWPVVSATESDEEALERIAAASRT